MKTYLGDGCYVERDGDDLKLTTENGLRVTNVIYLEPAAFAALLRFASESTNELRDEDES